RVLSAGEPNSVIDAVPRPCIAKAKSDSPSRKAKISRARHSVRTSRLRCSPPCSAGTTAFRKPASPSALTRARHAASTSACGKPASVVSAKRASAAARRRCPSSKNGQLRGSSRPISLPLEDRLLLGGEGGERARKILRLHAQRLGDRLGLDGGLDRHRPFHVEHALGHGVRERRAGGEFGRELLRLGENRIAGREPIKETPALCPLPAQRAAGIEQIRPPAPAHGAPHGTARHPDPAR